MEQLPSVKEVEEVVNKDSGRDFTIETIGAPGKIPKDDSHSKKLMKVEEREVQEE